MRDEVERRKAVLGCDAMVKELKELCGGRRPTPSLSSALRGPDVLLSILKCGLDVSFIRAQPGIFLLTVSATVTLLLGDGV